MYRAAVSNSADPLQRFAGTLGIVAAVTGEEKRQGGGPGRFSFKKLVM